MHRTPKAHTAAAVLSRPCGERGKPFRQLAPHPTSAHRCGGKSHPCGERGNPFGSSPHAESANRCGGKSHPCGGRGKPFGISFFRKKETPPQRKKQREFGQGSEFPPPARIKKARCGQAAYSSALCSFLTRFSPTAARSRARVGRRKPSARDVTAASSA